MPSWLVPVVTWVGTRFLHLLIYGTIILGVGFGLYKVFLQKTSISNTTYTQPVVQNHYNEQAKYAPFSCARITEDKLK